MAVSIEQDIGTGIELHGEQLDRRRRLSVKFGVAGYFLALLVAACVSVFVWQWKQESPLFPLDSSDWKRLYFSDGMIPAPAWMVLCVAAACTSLMAIVFGLSGLSRSHRETRILAVTGILLGLATFAMLGFVVWFILAFQPVVVTHR